MYRAGSSGKAEGQEEPGAAVSDETGSAGEAPGNIGREGDELDRYIEQVGRFIPREKVREEEENGAEGTEKPAD